MQITTLIIAPVFFTTALYILLGTLINLLGRQSSLLSARMYTLVFLTCDVVSLVVQVSCVRFYTSRFAIVYIVAFTDSGSRQAVGGAMASISSGKREDPETGTNVMVGGVIFQLAAMTIFAGLAVDFVRRSSKGALPREYSLALISMFISLTVIYARSIFRAVELIEGWTGHLMTHEKYFIALDGSLMVIAVGVFLALDPAILVPREDKLSRSSSIEHKP